MRKSLRKMLGKVIARSALIRNAAVSVAGSLVATGLIDPDGAEAIVAGVIVLLTGVLNYWIEGEKSKYVVDVQEALGVEADGYLGPETRQTLRKRLGR